MLIDKLISIPFLIFLPMLASLIIMSPFFTSNEISIRRFARFEMGEGLEKRQDNFAEEVMKQSK